MPSSGTLDAGSPAPSREALDTHKGEEEPEENPSKEEKQEPGTPMRKAGRPGRKRKHAQVESSDTPKDIAAVPKCPPPRPEASPAEPLPNGDVEGDAEEAAESPKGGRAEEDETESLPDGETGRALENGRCTPKEGLDAPADEGELAPSDPQKKRGRRKLLEATEKSKRSALGAPCCRAQPPGTRGPTVLLCGGSGLGSAAAGGGGGGGGGGGRAEPLHAMRGLGWGQQVGVGGCARMLIPAPIITFPDSRNRDACPCARCPLVPAYPCPPVTPPWHL
ncbi:DNA (cytosine-5)-methyltransferase 3A-like isoform X2 [Corvus kubaryi]|uniref:DNA (cytosine-5)-methyltransferase 3A-like isoform X2 n=1 Tax=Corvus kubaryi TaxID=68294 RepID=UPI001C03C469|nr:DNA (cytosine-5)-methyltransferase 3A-like isoform X2 [Corvus kubaryi]